MPLFRCTACQGEFEAARPACAACGLDPEADPRDKGAVVSLVTVHFDAPGRRPGVGVGHAACDPRLKVGRPRCAFSGEPSAVNCPKCKATEAFAAAGGDSAGVRDEVAGRPLAPKPGE